MPHGTVSRYSNGGCRCSECRRANAASHRDLMERYKAEGGRGEHGTSYRYDTGCRCDACRKAHNEKSRAQKKRARERNSAQ
jgi:plasmid replication initiation protein